MRGEYGRKRRRKRWTREGNGEGCDEGEVKREGEGESGSEGQVKGKGTGSAEGQMRLVGGMARVILEEEYRCPPFILPPPFRPSFPFPLSSPARPSQGHVAPAKKSFSRKLQPTRLAKKGIFSHTKRTGTFENQVKPLFLS
jgi:hypothetical protein